MIMIIDYNFVNQFWKECWLLVIDYCFLVIDYQRVKLFGKRFFFFKNSCAIQCFEKTLLILILIESSLDSWILSLYLNLESWSWFVKLSWLLILWNLLHSWFFGIIKIILEDIVSTISPFLMMTILKSREYIQVLFYRSLISFSPFLFEFMINFKVLKI